MALRLFHTTRLFALFMLAAPPLHMADAADTNLNAVEKRLMAAAKAEGEVTIINPLFSDRTAVRMAESFVKRYDLGPTFKFNNLRKGTGATVSQVRQEIIAGKFTVDVHLVSAPGFFDEAADRGAFLELECGYWDDFKDLIERAGQYSRFPYVVTPLAYTFQPVWNSSCPGMKDVKIESYEDALAASLKGKSIASDITKSFTYTNTVVSLIENKVIEPKAFWEKLKATDPVVEFRTEPKMQMVISCQRPLGMWNVPGRVYQNVVKEPKLADIIKIGHYKEGQVMLGNQVAVLKGPLILTPESCWSNIFSAKTVPTFMSRGRPSTPSARVISPRKPPSLIFSTLKAKSSLV